MVDTTFEFGRRDSFRHASIPSQRDATDIGNQPGENTINPQGLWRSEVVDWSHGTGQRWADRGQSDVSRFRHSQGIDPFTNPGYISLLKDTTQVISSNDSALQVLTVAGFIYYLTTTGVKFASSTGGLASPTSVAGLPGSGLVMMCTDGYNIYIAAGTGGVYQTTAGATGSATHLVNVASNNVYFVAFCSNVLLVADSNTGGLYQVSTAITVWPTALIKQGDSSWLWNCACGGFGWIYIGGYSGSSLTNSQFGAIYKTQMESDGTTLTAPTLSAPLPPGEIPYALFSFVNFVCLGTNQGFRFCQTLSANDPGGTSGDLKVGSIIPNLQESVTKPVRCFTAQNRFVYFGWSNYSASTVNATDTQTGLGWADISRFTGDLTPAYSSNVMVSGQTGEVTSLAWWNGAPIFTIGGVGIYTTATTYVPSGNVQSGYIGFRIPDQKVLIAYSVDLTDAASSVGASIKADDGTAVSLGTQANIQRVLFSVPQIRGELVETTLTLTAGNSATTTPTVRRATLQAFPAITAGDNIIVSLRFYDQVILRSGSRRQQYVYNELAFLENLRATQTVTTYQEGSQSWSVVIDDLDFVAYEPSELPSGGFQGVCVVTMKTATSGLIT